jgi:hypothetical protein
MINNQKRFDQDESFFFQGLKITFTNQQCAVTLPTPYTVRALTDFKLYAASLSEKIKDKVLDCLHEANNLLNLFRKVSFLFPNL